MAHLCRLLSYDKEDGQRCSILWQVQHKTIVLLSRMIRLNPKRAGLIAKMMGSTTIIALVKSFHMGKLAAQLETGNKLDPDEEQVMNIVSAACKSDVNEELSISTTFLDVYTEKMTSQKKHERDADLFEPLQANKRGKTTS